MTARYLIWSNQHGAWWGPDRRGYTLMVEEAGRYPLDQARAIVRDATLAGQLVVPRASHLGYSNIDTLDEVLLMAPESVDDMLTYVGGRLAEPTVAEIIAEKRQADE